MHSDELADEELLTVQEVGEWLKVDPRYVYHLASSGYLARVYVGRYVRIPVDAVRTYIANHAVEARPVRPKFRGRRPGARAREHLRMVRDAQR